MQFLYKTGPTPIAISNNDILLPQFFDNYTNIVNVYEHVGFQNYKAFAQFLEANYFRAIKKESYPSQKKFYESVLGERRKGYEECCPEYIAQAKTFLAKKVSEFKTLDDLNVEVYVAKMDLEINGINRSGKSFKYDLLVVDNY